jgi:leucyl-tRNA synthetase
VSSINNVAAPVGAAPEPSSDREALEVRRTVHKALARTEESLERLRFNTAIAEIRKLSNALSVMVSSITTEQVSADVAVAYREAADVLVRLIAPMMPHLAEECWRELGHRTLVADAPWPILEPDLAREDEVTIPVQINGKRRTEIVVARDIEQSALEAEVLKLEPVQKALEGRMVRKIIVVPQRIVNVVV